MVKLFTKYNRINLLATITIFLLGCFAFTLLLKYVIISQLDEDLMIEKKEINAFVNHYHHFPAVLQLNDQYTSYYPVTGNLKIL